MTETIFITGTVQGLGFSLTQRFLRAGWQVFAGAYTSGDNLKELSRQFSVRLTLVPLDVTNLESVRRAAQTVSANTSSLEILINNAGVHLQKPVKPLEQLDFADGHFQQTMDVNAFGPLRVIQQFLPLLEKGKRKLIANISSEAGSIGDSKRTSEYAYCMSKSALNMGSKILQNYLQPRGLKVLAVQPGWMRTDMGGKEADLLPDDVAEDIFNLLMKPWRLDDEIFLDRLGKTLPW